MMDKQETSIAKNYVTAQKKWTYLVLCGSGVRMHSPLTKVMASHNALIWSFIH